MAFDDLLQHAGGPLSRRSLLRQTVLAGVATSLSGAAPAEPGIPEAAVRAIDAAVAACIRDGGGPGTAVAVSVGGKIAFARGYGMANLETGTPVGVDSVFRIGSLTKQFTAAAILALVDGGQFALDDPVMTVLQGFPRDYHITIRELLTHTSGIHDGSAPICTISDPPKTQFELAKAIWLQPEWLDFPPGSAWSYSNANYIILGAILEQTFGRSSLAESMRSLVLNPLELSATACDDTVTIVPGRVSGTAPIPGKAGQYTHAAYIPVDAAGGAGSMRSTVGDLCRWHYQLLRGPFAKRPVFQEMFKPARLRNGALASTHRFLASDAAYGSTEYGFGLLLPPPVQGHRTIAHYGFIDGFSAYLQSFVDAPLTVAVLTNADSNPKLPFSAIRRAVIELVLPTV